MTVGEVLELPGRADRRDGPAFDLVVSKLRRPRPRPGTVRRAVLERLVERDVCPVVSVVAPAGFGKTTLLADWAERDRRTFAWLSVDSRDNDPRVLLAYIAQALDRVEPVGQRVFDALNSPASSVPGSVVPRLAAAFAAMSSPVALVIDDVHQLHNRECRSALSMLAEHVPVGARLIFAGRDAPPLRIARLRAEGRITEVGPGELSLTRGEAAALLHAADVTLDADEVALLHERTEGWPVGLYLAALYLRQGGSIGNAAASFGGDDRLVSEYLESEFLDRISGPHREFLTRSAALLSMSGALCEAALEQPGAAATLAELAESNLLLVPLDRRGKWYRYHHLFGEMLLAQLERLEPGLSSVVRRRAAAWCLDSGRSEEALEYSILADDVETVASLLPGLWGEVYRQGKIATLQRWFGWLDERDGIERHPMNAVNAAFLGAVTGDAEQAQRWTEVVERLQSNTASWPTETYLDALAATLRAITCRHGVERMRADADQAARKFADANAPFVTPLLLQGTARILAGDLDSADGFFAAGTRTDVEHPSTAEVSAMTLCERSIVAIAHQRWGRAGEFADRAHDRLGQAGIEESFTRCAVSALRARVALHVGDRNTAERERAVAMRLRPLLTYAFPHWACQVRIELIRVHRALGDVAGAKALIAEIDDIIARRPDLGTLVAEANALRGWLNSQRTSKSRGASALSDAELRVLPLLSTHMTAREIAAVLFLSHHTINAQTKSIYRKLGATTRHQAVTRARELQLLDT
jgi:LuxR family maltose regulon positive regulatory protein